MDTRVSYSHDARGFTMTEMVRDDDGNWTKTERTHRFDLADLPDTFEDGDGVTCLAAFGLQLKLQTAHSQLKGQATFAELADAYAEYFRDVLMNGRWNKPRKGGGRKAVNTVYLAQALIDAGKASGEIAAVAAKLATLDAEKLKTLAEAYAEEIRAIKEGASDVKLDI